MTLIRKKPRSEARDRLASAIEARRDLQNELSAISASLARLSDLAAKPAKIEQAIAAIDAEGGNALAVWAKSGDGPAPTPNAQKRAALVADLSVAKASAGAAEAAYTGIAANYNATTARTKALDDAISAAVVGITAEELAPIADKAQAIASELAAIRDAVIEGAAFARGLGMKIGSGPAVVSTELTACQKALDTAMANPPTDFGALAAVKGAWKKLADDLISGDDGVFFSVAS
jgi:adenylosuccinate synthase